MIFNAKERLKGISLRVDLMNRFGESDYFKRCEDCPHRVCLQGIAADEYSRSYRSNYAFHSTKNVGKNLCRTAARAYLELLTEDQFENLMRIQEFDDMETYIAARVIKTFSETGSVILEGKIR